MAHYALALDVGGTFTDVMLMHRESGQLWIVKTPSTPMRQRGFSGDQKILSLAEVAPAAVDHLLHGSTVATNTILEGKGASTGMSPLRVLSMSWRLGGTTSPARQSYAWVKPPRCRRGVLLEVHERCSWMDVDVPSTKPVVVVMACRHGGGGSGHRLPVCLCQCSPRAAASIMQDEIPQVQVSLE